MFLKIYVSIAIFMQKMEKEDGHDPFFDLQKWSCFQFLRSKYS